jgi:hypothetical protein
VFFLAKPGLGIFPQGKHATFFPLPTTIGFPGPHQNGELFHWQSEKEERNGSGFSDPSFSEKGA